MTSSWRTISGLFFVVHPQCTDIRNRNKRQYTSHNVQTLNLLSKKIVIS